MEASAVCKRMRGESFVGRTVGAGFALAAVEDAARGDDMARARGAAFPLVRWEAVWAAARAEGAARRRGRCAARCREAAAVVARGLAGTSSPAVCTPLSTPSASSGAVVVVVCCCRLVRPFWVAGGPAACARATVRALCSSSERLMVPSGNAVVGVVFFGDGGEAAGRRLRCCWSNASTSACAVAGAALPTGGDSRAGSGCLVPWTGRVWVLMGVGGGEAVTGGCSSTFPSLNEMTPSSEAAAACCW